jgi:hypothetical protein
VGCVKEVTQLASSNTGRTLHSKARHGNLFHNDICCLYSKPLLASQATQNDKNQAAKAPWQDKLQQILNFITRRKPNIDFLFPFRDNFHPTLTIWEF